MLGGLLSQSGEDRANQPFHVCVNLPGVVQAHQSVSQQGGESMHRGPQDELGPGACRRRQTTGLDELVQLGGQHVMGMRRNWRLGLIVVCAEREACDRRILHRPTDIRPAQRDHSRLWVLPLASGARGGFPDSLP